MESNPKLEHNMEKPTMTASENVPDTTIPPPPAAQPPLIVPEDLRDLGLEQQDKRVHIGGFVLWLGHRDNCYNRPEYQAAYPGGCTIPMCMAVTELVQHGKQCTAGDRCLVTDCSLSKRIFQHCTVCTLASGCSVCELYNYRRNQTERLADLITLASVAGNDATKPIVDNTQNLMPVVDVVLPASVVKMEAKVASPMSHEVQSGPDNRYRNMSDQDVRNELQNLGALTDELKDFSRMLKQNPGILPEFIDWMGSRPGQGGSNSGQRAKTEDKGDGNEATERQSEEDEKKEGESSRLASGPADQL